MLENLTINVLLTQIRVKTAYKINVYVLSKLYNLFKNGGETMSNELSKALNYVRNYYISYISKVGIKLRKPFDQYTITELKNIYDQLKKEEEQNKK
ncbi:hypothetical protein BC6307_10930 [Sutcliffiella cohnii]|uniref:Uncharacterized protein n=2 Tax=Bacillaceae TaxID=186817 RepID=A0A223KQQ8_9BACI|nr:hypothetical protein BC6307_10930 [Sutcliffiella cohnii]